ncbi:unnamed protein product [Moneuplotes crassus]|uniref:Uncharacterized protein n=1 Tax=Euplotes crassus TaxID=5936 RepID=A0AAD2D229_EUPCR|nr:unnamed protein product [Moneuplotes crassus]
MEALFLCTICTQPTFTPLRLCENQSCQGVIDKCRTKMQKCLKEWRGCVKMTLDKTEKLMQQSEQILDKNILATGYQAVDLENPCYSEEYFSVVSFKLFLAKFKTLRLQNIDKLVINKQPNERRKIYGEYFTPMKHHLKYLDIISENRNAKLGWNLALITLNAYRIETLNVQNFTVSIKQFNRILQACSSAKHLSFSNCKFIGTDGSQLSYNAGNNSKGQSLVRMLSVTNSELQGEFRLIVNRNFELWLNFLRVS